MGSPGPPIPGTPQLRTPPRPRQVVTMVARTPVPTQTSGTTTMRSPVPQTPIINISHIQDKTHKPQYLLNKNPQVQPQLPLPRR